MNWPTPAERGKWFAADPRFWERVDVGAPDACWLWKLTIGANGYGTYCLPRDGGSSPRIGAHRWALGVALGRPVREDMDTDHLCRNRTCVNPAHLEEVTRGENVLRGASCAADNARKSQCLNGHEFNPKNTQYTARGRKCRVCARERVAAYRRINGRRK
jgi:hypothetical protein